MDKEQEKSAENHQGNQDPFAALGPDEDQLKPLLKLHLPHQSVVLPWERREDYVRLRISLIMQLRPEGELEYVIFDHLVADMWELRRLQGYKTSFVVGRSLAESTELATLHEAAKSCAGTEEETNWRWESTPESTSLAMKEELGVPYSACGIFEPEQDQPASVARHQLTRDVVLSRLAGVWQALAAYPVSEDPKLASDPLERMEQRAKEVQASMYRHLREIERLQERRRAVSAIPQAALDLSVNDVIEELDRRKRTRTKKRRAGSPSKTHEERKTYVND